MTQIITQELAAPPTLSVSQLCSALALYRAEYYRHSNPATQAEPDLESRREVQAIAADMPAYGYRRITAQLGRNGVVANHSEFCN